MAKDKKKQSKKEKNHNDLLDDAAKSIRKFRKVTKNIGRLTTGQKLVGGIALLAAGLTYLAKKQAEAQSEAAPASAADSAPADETEAPLLEAAATPAEEPKASRRSRKNK